MELVDARARVRIRATCRPTPAFAERVRETQRGLLDFLIEAKRAGKKVVGYGAPAKATPC